MAMTWEQALAQIEALTQQVTTLIQQGQNAADHIQQLIVKANAADETHRQIHQELVQTKALRANGQQDFRLIDPKTMKPDKLGSDKGPAWKQWSEDTRAFVENLSTTLAKELKQVEGRDDALTEDDLANSNVADAHGAQMSRFLRLNTEGHANTMVKASADKGEHALETWRLLSKEFDPKGLGTELVELSDLVTPAKLRAKNPTGISAAIESWESMERRVLERQDTRLPEKIRVTCLLKLVPEKLAGDVLKQQAVWQYQKLKDHLLTLQHLQTNGPAPMIYNIEKPEEEQAASEGEIFSEDGELLRLERRNGKQVVVRPTQPSGGKTQGRTATKKDECWKCGRPGHFGRDCRSKTHKDGGPLRKPTPRRPAGNLENEEEEESAEPGEVQVGTLELNALSLIESDHSSDDGCTAWSDWMQDPVMDPWQCSPCESSPPQAFKLPTLKDLYKWTDICTHCDKAGVYAKVISKLRPEQFPKLNVPVTKPVLPPRYTPQTPMPTGPPRTITLSSCVPEPPEEEVLEWIPEASSSPTTNTSISPRPCCCFHCLHKQCKVDFAISAQVRRELPVQPEHEDIVLELNNVELTSEEKLKYDRVEVTLDSGAGAPVANPDDFPGCVVTDSPGSLAGQVYVGPGNEKIPNEGQFVAPMRLEDGRMTQSTYQAARVRKPLMAVSSVNDKGNLVMFDDQGSFIIPGGNKSLITQIRALVQKVPDKVKLHRKNGVFHMKAWKLKPGFPRQGR